MVIDIHSHLWPMDRNPESMRRYFQNRNSRFSFDADGLLASMEAAGIDRTVVSALAFGPELTNQDIRGLNQYVADAVRQSDQKLLGFCTLNPFEAGSVDFLRSCMEDQGFAGLKLHCNMQRFYPNDERLDAVYRQMQEYGKPILFHSGGIGVRPYGDIYGRPVYMDETALKFPELKIILGHAGRIWYEETAMLLRKHPNIYADVSTNFGKTKETLNWPMQQLLQTVKGWAGSTGHLLFGSDFPFYEQTDTRENLEDLADGLTDSGLVTAAEVRRIITVNTETFLNKFI